MDAQYGYDAVNVESSGERCPFPAQLDPPHAGGAAAPPPFGRGTQRFLYPGNRKVFAFLRELKSDDGEDDETILCVSNLSRTAQAVELDLSAFAGRALVDVVGGSVFPPASQLPYLLTLPPYAFYWFQLATQAQLPDWRAGSPEALPEFATLVIRRRLEEALAGHNLAVIETEVLPAYLPKRRWFASKGEQLARRAHRLCRAAAREQRSGRAGRDRGAVGGSRGALRAAARRRHGGCARTADPAARPRPPAARPGDRLPYRCLRPRRLRARDDRGPARAAGHAAAGRRERDPVPSDIAAGRARARARRRNQAAVGGAVEQLPRHRRQARAEGRPAGAGRRSSRRAR